MIKTKKQMFVVIGAFALILLLGTVSYAFFNYTRTGGANNLGTGSIYFLATESNERINITNFFPTATGAQPDGSNSGSMTIAVEAGTSYEYGIDYSLKAVNVSIPSGVTNIPVKVTTSAVNDTGKDIGFSGVTGVTLANDISLGAGHVAGKANGGLSGNRETGTITVTAYIDAADVAITDTYNGTESDPMGTTTEWVRGRRVITTTEWNRLATTPITFKVKVEAGEGSAQVTPPTCPGPQCVYMWVDDYAEFMYGDEGDTIENIKANFDSNSISYLYSLNYEDVVTSERRFFMGMILENVTSGKITRAFACGINDYSQNPVPFCIEGSNDGSTYNANVDVINTAFDVNDQCGSLSYFGGGYQCSIYYDEFVHHDVSIRALAFQNGVAYTEEDGHANVYINNNGTVSFDPYGS